MVYYGGISAKENSADPVKPPKPVERLKCLAILDWIVEAWLELLIEQTEQLCEWLNQPPTIDLRVNLALPSSKQSRRCNQLVSS